VSYAGREPVQYTFSSPLYFVKKAQESSKKDEEPRRRHKSQMKADSNNAYVYFTLRKMTFWRDMRKPLVRRI